MKNKIITINPKKKLKKKILTVSINFCYSHTTQQCISHLAYARDAQVLVQSTTITKDLISVVVAEAIVRVPDSSLQRSLRQRSSPQRSLQQRSSPQSRLVTL